MTVNGQSRTNRIVPIVIGLLGSIISVLVWHYRLRFPFDDVYISFRYAEHLASGNGLAWNIGGPHTEGYTNFLFILLLAGIRLFQENLLPTAQIMGLVSTIITGMIIFAVAKELRSTVAGIAAACLYFLTPLTWINALSGMETSLFAMWVTLAIFFAVRERYISAFGTIILATLTRPEGALLALIVFFTILSRNSERFRWDRRTFVMGVGMFILAMGCYALWKWQYFGALLPNSFYVKVMGESATHHSMLPGLQYVRLFVESMLVIVILSFGIRRWRGRAITILAAWVGTLLVFYLFVVPLEGLYDRFLWPAVPALCVLAATGIHDVAQRWNARWTISLGMIAIAAHLMLSIVSPREKQSLAAHEDAWDASMDPIVNILKRLPHADSLRLAYGDAGYVVYRSGIYHIDVFGLNDTRIARAKSVSEREGILRQERPDILLLPIRATASGNEWVEDAFGLARDSSFEAVAVTPAFPLPLAWVLDKNGHYYRDCKMALQAQWNDSGAYLLPVSSIR